MNDNLSDDPDLTPHLDAVRDDLVSRPPRHDARIEHLLGAAPPVPPTSPHDELDPVPVVSLADERGPRRAVVAGLMAAGIVLIAAIAAIAYRGGPDPAVEAADGGAGDAAPASSDDPDIPVDAAVSPPAAEADPDEADPDGTGSDDADSLDADVGPLEEHREWVECVLDAFHEALDGEDPPDFRRLDIDPTEACGEPPGLDLKDLDGHFGPFDPEEWQGLWPGSLDEWEPGEHFPGWPGLDLGEWDPEKWADRLDLDGVCEEETSDEGVSVRCTWPPCEGDDCVPDICPDTTDEGDDAEQTHCFGFGFHFDGDLKIEPGEWPEKWNDWFDPEPRDDES